MDGDEPFAEASVETEERDRPWSGTFEHANAPSEAETPSTNASNGRVCVECGAGLPAGWRALYCARHDGRGDDKVADPRADPRFAATVANHAALSAADFAALGAELAWFKSNQPDVDDLALDLAAYSEARRRREHGAVR